MNPMNFILVLVTIPLLAAVGVDIYLNFYDQKVGTVTLDRYYDDNLKLSAIGFLWTHFEPESYKNIRDSIEPETWKMLDTYVLDQKSVSITGSFAAFWYLIALLFKLTGIGPYKKQVTEISNSRQFSKIKEVLGEKSGGAYKYKRR